MKNRFTLCTKGLLIALALGCFSQLSAQRNLIFSTHVASSTDDAEERGTNTTGTPGVVDLTSSDLELVEDGSDGDQWVGIRFQNISLPPAAIIDSVFIQFTVDEDDAANGAKFIQIQKADSTSTFNAVNFSISTLPVFADTVVWDNIPIWDAASVGTAGPNQKSPDLKMLLDSVMSQSGWKNGNALSFIITGTGERVAESYDGSVNSAPELIIHYSLPSVTTFSILNGNDDAEEDLTNGSIDIGSSDLELVTENNDQGVGMRFDNISIPQGATITNAYLQFQVDESTASGNVDVLLLVEDVANATPYSFSTNDITGRSYDNSTGLVWNVNGWPTVGVKGVDQRSPNLTAMVQRIVDKSNWFAGNAIAFGAIDPVYLSVPGFTGNTGKRTAESFDGSGGPELIIEYLEPLSYVDGAFPISKLSSWKFLDDSTDLTNSNWTAVNYNDSSWAFGDAVLGYNNGNESTTIDFGNDPNNKNITTYLRHTFNGANTAQFDSLIFDVLRDDGVVVYLNGTEVFRQNMPSGAVNFGTTATTVVGGADETTYYRNVINNTLNPGRNVIAVELHQQAATSSDLSFDLEVSGKLPPLATTSYPVSSGDDWNYLDNGADLTTTNWKDLNYNDTTWSYGPSPLGYSNPVATTVSFGPDPADKYITTYFRKRVNIANLNALSDSLILNVKRDDGAVIYVNGTEVVRENMPAGPINFRTESSTIVSGADEDAFFATRVSKNVFANGVNIIAVELHQRDSSSSDLSFDMEILEVPNARKACSGPNDRHISCFTSLFPTNQGPDFFIPETHAFQLLLEQGDAYSDQSVRATAPGNNDFTGYVARGGSSINGWVGVNHENTPGGVSIIDIHYNDTTRLWNVDSSAAVDFYNNDLVTTTRNCSGGITPWGTIITSEETTNSGDANSDGYEDVGWQVEIDPATRSVVEYGTPGKQEKLWAMGRMSHENIAVANDSMTAYQGEDRGSGCLYKFVANNKMDLSSGTLYALQLTGGLTGGEPNSTNGVWIPIPNTTQADRNTTNSIAISLGATPFNGIEDAEIGTIDGKIYFTSKGYDRVYRFTDDNNSTVSNFETFVGAQNYLINYGSGVVSEPWASGNDNLCFDDLGNLYVLQDGSRDHVWMVGPSHTQTSPVVDIFAKLPAGSEPCGMTFTPDYKFMFLSVQHPSGANSSTTQIDAAGNAVTMAQSATLVIARKEFLGNYAPLTAATNLSFVTSACDTANLSFNTGNGTGHIVVAKEATQVNVNPNDGFTYNADLTFGNGDDLGQGNFVMYDGLDSTLRLSGLKQNTEYHVSIFEYNEDPNKFYGSDLAPIDSVTTAAVGTGVIAGNFNPVVSSTETYSVPNTVNSTYNWTAGAGTIVSGQGTNTIDVTWPSSIGTSDLKVVETNVRTCEGDTVFQAVNYGLVGLADLNLDRALNIYPNPSNGRSTLTVNGTSEPFNLTVTDMVGKTIIRANNVTNIFEIDLSGEEKGTYVLRLDSQSKTATKMLIVQ